MNKLINTLVLHMLARKTEEWNEIWKVTIKKVYR